MKIVCSKKHDRKWGVRGIRYPAPEKLEIIRTVECSHLPVKQTLDMLCIPRSTFYRWYDLYVDGGVDALADHSTRPGSAWNCIPNARRDDLIEFALEHEALSTWELVAYAAGSLPHPFAAVVAAHISLCLERWSAYEAHQAAGGVVLEVAASQDVSSNLKNNVLDLLDEPVEPEPTYKQSGAFPAPVTQALKGKPPCWKSLGMGVRQSILSAGPEWPVRLLFIPPGQVVPDHSHNGLELTLVLQGSFKDETGRFGVGDLEVADQDLDHTPIADMGAPCICLAATDAPLRFNTFIPRMLQSLFGI